MWDEPVHRYRYIFVVVRTRRALDAGTNQHADGHRVGYRHADRNARRPYVHADDDADGHRYACAGTVRLRHHRLPTLEL
jgi:hypothetical protein